MRKLVLPLALALTASTASAQCFDIVYGTPIGTPGQMFGTQTFPMQAIGFPFPIGGTTYTDMVVCDQGFVWLSNAGVPADGGADFSPTAAEFASGSPRVAALWGDIQVTDANNGMVFVKSTPTACTISWINAQCYGGNSGVFSMQMVLSITGEVKVLFGPGTTNNSDPTQPTWQVGISGISPGLGATLPAASDLSAGGSTTDPMVYEQFTLPNTFDLADNGLLFLPSSPGYAFVPLGAPANCAQVNKYGTGCVAEIDSMYEAWNSGFDLNGSTVTWLRSGNGYLVTTAIPGTFVAPSAAAVNVASGMLDAEQAFPLSSPMPAPGGVASNIVVSTKGQIQLTNTLQGVDYTPTVAELLDHPVTQFCLWHDYNQTPATSGLILFEEVGGITYITWNGVESFSSSAQSTFQFQLDRVSGIVTLVIQTMGGFANPDAGILGYSVGGPSSDPGATDFATLASTISLADVGSDGLALDVNSTPSLGNSSFALVTSNVPNLVPVGVTFFGTTVVNPGVDLTFLGMAGCFAYTDATLGGFTFTVAGGVGQIGLPIPSNPLLVGAVLTAQSVAFSNATVLTLVSSNGVELVLGN
jgi:hypothetical protein